MIKLIKLKEKYIKRFEKNNLDSNIVKKNKLEIYFMILGYFSYKNDMPFNYGSKEILNEITEKISLITDDNYNFFGISDNHHDSFRIAINRLSNKNIENILSKDDILEYFNIGYEYAKYLSRNSGIMDYLLGNYSRKEYKLIKSLYK